jgi:hypothetical protein
MGKSIASKAPWREDDQGIYYKTVYSDCLSASDVLATDRPEAIGYQEGAADSWRAYLGRHY